MNNVMKIYNNYFSFYKQKKKQKTKKNKPNDNDKNLTEEDKRSLNPSSLKSLTRKIISQNW